MSKIVIKAYVREGWLGPDLCFAGGRSGKQGRKLQKWLRQRAKQKMKVTVVAQRERTKK